jgi:multidrug efflux pump
MQRTVEEKTELFETMPIRRAAMTLVIPTVISQLVMLVYNMADTWYIGQTGDPYQVAAVTVTYPIFMMMNALANLFGIGGSSLVSRMLGGGEQKKTGAIAAFSLWTAGGVTLCYSLVCLLFDRQFLALLGTDAGTCLMHRTIFSGLW